MKIKFINLQILNLNSNDLVKLPEEIGFLPELTVLDLHNNQLESIPNSINQLPNIERIYLSENKDLSLTQVILDDIDNKNWFVVV